MEKLNHFDRAGNAVMVDVSEKEETAREAVASGRVEMNAATLKVIQSGSAKKGDVLGVARIAGIMAAKKTASLIPLCHPISFDKCVIDFDFLPALEAGAGKDSGADGEGLCGAAVTARCAVRLSGKTGAEMEALTGVSVALLTIYDMCKAIDRRMTLNQIRLEEKSGGKSGHFKRENHV